MSSLLTQSKINYTNKNNKTIFTSFQSKQSQQRIKEIQIKLEHIHDVNELSKLKNKLTMQH